MNYRAIGPVAFVTALALAAGAPAHAEDLDAELRVALQSSMLEHIDNVLSDGAYTYLDRDTDTMRTVYPANVHPFVVKAQNEYFVCSEMVDEEGKALTADFLVRKIGDKYRVIQMIVNDRASLMALMKKSG